MSSSWIRNALFATVAGAALAGFAGGAYAQVGSYGPGPVPYGYYGEDYGYGPAFEGPGRVSGYVTPGSWTPGYLTPAQHNACMREFYQQPARVQFRC